MTLKQIKTASLSELKDEEARINTMKEKGLFIGNMLKKRLAEIAKEIHKRSLDALVVKPEKPIIEKKQSRELEEGDKLVPLEDYYHPNKKGEACSRSWKHRLVKLDVEGISQAPFDYLIESDRTYIIVKNQN